MGLLAAIAPAQAQPDLRFGFGFFDDDHDHFFFRRPCLLTDRSLRNAIADAGYEDVFLNVPRGRYVQARARKGDWIYLLEVNICSGAIVDRERLRRAS
jgi:hypothetical protein